MRPPTNFSWVDLNLATSAYPGDHENIEYLVQQLQIEIIINLTHKIYDNPFPEKLTLIQYTIPDYGVPDDDIQQLIRAIDVHIKQGKKILIHCKGGCGRTGVVVALYQVLKYPERNRTQIIANLRQLRPCSVETEEQLQYILNFEFT